MRTSSLLAIAVVLALPVPTRAQTFRVSAVSPAANANRASTAAPVRLTFTEPVRSASVTAKTVRIYGRWSGIVPGVLRLDPTARQLTFAPSRPYFPGELVSVHVSSSLTSTSNRALSGGFTASFWAGAAAGTRKFRLKRTIALRRPGEKWIATYGIHAGDVDGDGSPDITAAQEKSFDLRLLHNDGCGNFGAMTRISAPKQEISPTDGADFNGDGIEDLVSGNTASNAMSVFFGDGKGSYSSPTIYATGGRTHGIAVVDANTDGHMDILAPNHASVLLFLNDGTGKFKTPKSIDTGGDGEDNVGIGDANGDGIADLFVGNYTSNTIVLMLGDGAGGFKVSATRSTGGLTFSSALGDVDGDGNLDVATVQINKSQLALCFGDGKGGLSQAVLYLVGTTPVSIDLGDLDGDGFLDCVVSSYSTSDYTVYWNDRKGKFVNRMQLASTKAGSCATLVDFDRDGDLDIIGTDETADEARLYSQDDPVVNGAQLATCGATLRLNNLARLAGFGSAPDTPLNRGWNAFFGVSGPAASTFAIGIGVGTRPGSTGPLGTYNLSGLPLIILTGTTNAFGEATMTVPVPSSLPTGVRVALQALVSDPRAPVGALLTNPEWVVTK